MVHCQYFNLLVVYSWSRLVDVSVAWICPSHIRYLHRLAELRCTDNQHLSSKNSWRFEDTVWSNGYKFKEVVILVKTNFTAKEMSPNGWGPRPDFAKKFWKHSFTVLVRLGLTVHTNPSQNRSFYGTALKAEKFENVGGALVIFALNTNPKWPMIDAFLNFVVWRKCLFRVPVFKFLRRSVNEVWTVKADPKFTAKSSIST